MAPAPLSSDLEAQRDFRRIEDRWAQLPPGGRKELEPPLRAFLDRHGGDPRVATVCIYLAWVLIEQGQLDEARELTRPRYPGKEGAVVDSARVAEAAILLREKRHAKSLEVLLPLRGKIIEAEELLLFNEQLVHAALGAGKHADALDYMVDWAEQAPEEHREAVTGRLEILVREVEPAAAEARMTAWDERATSDPRGSRHGARNWLRRLLRAQLSRRALERQDVDLARRLLASRPPALRRDPSTEALRRLASEGEAAPQVVDQVIGVVLELFDRRSRRRSSEVVSGVTRTLSLLESEGKPVPQLVTREAVGSVEELPRALGALAGEGATVLVAGVSPDSARAAGEFAEQATVPVLLLDRPGDFDPSPYAFVLGVEDSADDRALSRTLGEAGVRLIQRVGDTGYPCGPTKDAPALTRFPIDGWRRAGVQALLLLGDDGCSRNVAAEARQMGLDVPIALGFEGAPLVEDLTDVRLLWVRSGRFPRGTNGSRSAAWSRWVETMGFSPTWYQTLGHDAAVLAAAVLAQFSDERTAEATAVERLQQQARRSLSEVEADLWSTEASGFEGGNTISRKLSVGRREVVP